MKHHRAPLAISLGVIAALIALVLAPTLAFAASQRIVNEKGASFSSFADALAAVPDGGSTTLTFTNPDNATDALDLKLDRNISVAITAPASGKNNPRIGSIEVSAGTVTLAAEQGRSIEVTGVTKASGATLTATRCRFKDLVRGAAGSTLALNACEVIDPESSKKARSDTNATIYLSNRSTACISGCQVDGDIGVGSGCTLSSVKDTKVVSRGVHSENGIFVASGGTVGEIRGSTIYGTKSALLFMDASATIIERSNIITGSGNKIDPGTNASDWKGCKIEKSLEGSGRGMGYGRYYGADREFDVTWFKGIIPEGYSLSRWTNPVEIPFEQKTFNCRYLIRRDCSLTYDANGGTGNMSTSNKTKQWGDRALKVAQCGFACEGRTFKNWNTKPDGTGKSYAPGASLSFQGQAQVTLYAQWSGKRCTLSFDSRGGTPVASQAVAVGEAFTRPADPTYAVGSRSYDFAGWYTDAACTKAYDFATKATGDLRLYAKWLPSTCTLVFDSMGGTHLDGVTVKYGEAAARPADPTRPHYRFKGWYEDASCTHAYDFATRLTEESRTIYAKWGDYSDCHVWDEGVVTEEPRCMTKGARTYTCTADPGHTHTKTEYSIPRLGHDMTGSLEPFHWRGYADSSRYYTAPTCDKAGEGMYAQYCQRCGIIVRSEWRRIAPHGHYWLSWTKTEDGLREYRVCQYDASHREERAVRQEPCPHANKLAVEAKASTCTVPGNVAYWTCPDCMEWFLDEGCTQVVTSTADVLLPLADHTAGGTKRENVVAPTCVADGSHDDVTSCSVCGEEIWRETVTDPATGTHTPGAAEQANYVPASCEHAGTHDEIVSCTVCGQVLSWKTVEDAPALGHQAGVPTNENVKPATCEKAGSHDEVTRCTRCGEELERTWVIDDALGHDWGAWQTVTEATEYDEGLARRACSRNPLHVEYRAVPRLGHEHELLHVDAEPASCTAAGHREYWYCVGCGEWFLDEESTQPIEREGDVVVARLAHTPGDVVPEDVVLPTCEEDGHHDECTYCTGCGVLLSRRTVIDQALGHEWGAWETVEQAVGDAAGRERRVCARDASHVEERLIPAPHTHALEYVEAVEPTCLTEGMRAHWRCTVESCGACFSDVSGEGEAAVAASGLVLPRTGHTPDEKVTEAQWSSTCWYEGINHEVVYCAACGEELSRHVVPLALAAHTMGDPVRENEVASTCSVQGAHDEVVYCTVCSEELSRRNVSDPCTEHTPGEVQIVNVVEPTSLAPGSHDEVVCCAVCSSVLSWKTIVDPPLEATYYVAEGEGGSWTRGSSEPLRVVFKRKDYDEETFGLFRGIAVDGQEVPAEGYVAEAGSVVVSLKPAYLETLATGEHVLTALFEDGSAEARFTVAEAPAPTPGPAPAPTPGPVPQQSAALPRTGDPVLPVGLATIAALLLVCIGLRIRGRS